MDVIAIAGQPAIAGDSTPGAASFSAGGVGRNVAEALSRLAINTQLVSIVGNDAAGIRLLEHCEALGIDCSQVQVVDGQTSSYVAIHDNDGALLSAINAMSIIDQLCLDRLPLLNRSLQEAAVCVIDANLGSAFIKELSRWKIACDLVADAVSVVKCKRLLPLLPRLALLKVNRAEAVALTGSADSVSTDDLLEALLNLGCRQVLMTLGESGSIMATKQLTVRSKALPVADIQSVNGAGDSLFAGVLAGMLLDQDIHTQLQWGASAAALSLRTPDACSPQLSLQALQQS